MVLIKHEHYDRILQEYYFVMIYKDLVERYELKNVVAIKYFIRRILANITKSTSINKIYIEMKSLGISVGKNTLYELAEQLETIYLFLPLTKYEPSLVKETSSDRKYYSIDNGLTKALLANREDKGILLENQIFLWLRRKAGFQQNLHYYKGKKECDFVVSSGGEVQQLVQVAWDISENDTFQRETDGLIEASGRLKCNNLVLITADHEEEIIREGKTIHIVPAWKIMIL